jgi:ElaB/YqjD/DUF883 family membrane-anchored ribosome-binding protein
MNAGSEFKKTVEEKGEAIAAVVNDIADRVVNFNGKIEDQVDSAIKRARKAGHTVDDFARENPWQFAGVALAVGFLAGWLMKRKD